MRELILSDPALWLATGGLLVGLLFGLVGQRTNFCTMGAVADLVTLGDRRRLRAWVLAAATALLGAQLLDAGGAVPLDRSMYLAPSLNWLGHGLGGGLFGFGMVLAGGCGSRNLVRLGGGDLRALVVLMVMGLFAYMTIGGLLAPLRVALEQATSIDLPGPTQSLGDLAVAGLGGLSGGAMDATLVRRATALVVLAGLLLYCLADRGFRGSARHVGSGLAVGSCVVAGWALTGTAFDDLATRPVAPVSLTFVRPTADTFDWLQRFTAGRMPGFGVASVIGTVLGAALGALGAGRFRLAAFTDVGDTLRSLAGAALMGIGGVMALGCTVGQGITGISTLAAGAFITFAAIVAGAVLGLRRLERML